MGSMMQLELQLPLQLLQLGGKLNSGQCLEMQAAVNDIGHVANLVEVVARKWRCIVSAIHNPDNSHHGNQDSLVVLPCTEYTKLASVLPVPIEEVKEEDDPDIQGNTTIVNTNEQPLTSHEPTAVESPAAKKQMDSHQCGYCDKVYKRAGALQNHIARLHSLQASSSTQPLTSTPRPQRRQLRRKVVCGVCGDKFDTEDELLGHMEKKHNVMQNSKWSVGVTKLEQLIKQQALATMAAEHGQGIESTEQLENVENEDVSVASFPQQLENDNHNLQADQFKEKLLNDSYDVICDQFNESIENITEPSSPLIEGVNISTAVDPNIQSILKNTQSVVTEVETNNQQETLLNVSTELTANTAVTQKTGQDTANFSNETTQTISNEEDKQHSGAVENTQLNAPTELTTNPAVTQTTGSDAANFSNEETQTISNEEDKQHSRAVENTHKDFLVNADESGDKDNDSDYEAEMDMNSEDNSDSEADSQPVTAVSKRGSRRKQMRQKFSRNRRSRKAKRIKTKAVQRTKKTASCNENSSDDEGGSMKTRKLSDEEGNQNNEGSNSDDYNEDEGSEASHNQKNKKSNPKYNYKCPICERKAMYVTAIKSHITKKHKSMSKKDIECAIEDQMSYKRYKRSEGCMLGCAFCERTRPGPALLNHMQVWHKEENDYYKRRQEVVSKLKKLKLGGVRGSLWRMHIQDGFCCHCKQKFSGPEELKQHKKNDCTANKLIKTKNLLCFDCGFKATSKEDLLVHRKEHIKKPTGNISYVCELCGASYMHRGGLTSHLRVKHDIAKEGCRKEWNCEKCSKTFKYKVIYERHLLTHTTEMQATCDICGKPYKTKRDLDVHRKRIHFGIYPYHCKLCGHGVQRREWLTTHKCENVRPRQTRDRPVAGGGKGASKSQPRHRGTREELVQKLMTEMTDGQSSSADMAEKPYREGIAGNQVARFDLSKAKSMLQLPQQASSQAAGYTSGPQPMMWLPSYQTQSDLAQQEAGDQTEVTTVSWPNTPAWPQHF